MKTASRVIIAAVAAAAVGLAAFLALGRAAPAPARVLAPDVSFSTLQGERFSTAALRGRVVLVNFWATSCVTCVREMPKLVETYRKHRDRGFETVAVAIIGTRGALGLIVEIGRERAAGSEAREREPADR